MKTRNSHLLISNDDLFALDLFFFSTFAFADVALVTFVIRDLPFLFAGFLAEEPFKNNYKLSSYKFLTSATNL